MTKEVLLRIEDIFETGFIFKSRYKIEMTIYNSVTQYLTPGKYFDDITYDVVDLSENYLSHEDKDDIFQQWKRLTGRDEDYTHVFGNQISKKMLEDIREYSNDIIFNIRYETEHVNKPDFLLDVGSRDEWKKK